MELFGGMGCRCRSVYLNKDYKGVTFLVIEAPSASLSSIPSDLLGWRHLAFISS